MLCEKCGKEISDDLNLCSECLNEAENTENKSNDFESVSEDHSDKQKTPEHTENKRKHRVAAHIGATLFSIILALMLIVTTGLYIVRRAVSPDTIKEMITSVDLEEVKITDVADKEVFESHGLVCESDNLLDVVYDNIDQEKLPTPISKENFTAIIEDEEFRSYLGEVFGISIEALTSGDTTDLVTPENIVDCLGENREKFSSYLGYDLTDDRLDDLQTTLEEDYGEVFEAIGDQKLDVIVGNDFAEIINIIFADWLFWTLVIIDLFVCGLVFLVLRRIGSGIKYSATVILVVGLMFLCASIAIINGVLPSLGEGAIMTVFNQVASAVLWDTIVISSIMILIGILLPVSVILLGYYKKRRSA